MHLKIELPPKTPKNMSVDDDDDAAAASDDDAEEDPESEAETDDEVVEVPAKVLAEPCGGLHSGTFVRNSTKMMVYPHELYTLLRSFEV